MKHFSSEEWLAYINEELSKTKREELENHLYSCNQCLETYMDMVDSHSQQLPIIEARSFTDEVIRKLPQKKRRKVYQHPLFHYGVAAVITFTLMTTGFFQSITGIVETVEASPISGSEQTVSDTLMEKALSLIDRIEVKQRRLNHE